LRLQELEGRRLPSGFSTYLGGSQDDYGDGIAIDSAGDTFITTETDSPDYPVTVGSYHGGFDIAVTKLAPDGSLLWSGLYGGSGDEGAAIALDGAGNVYLTGGTNSADFPTTAEAYDQTYSGTIDNAFVMKVDGATGGLVYSTLLSGTTSAFGSPIDYGTSLAVDAAGDAYVVGDTVDSDFPVTAGAYQSAYGGGANDVFVAELNPDGSGLVYATYLGGGLYDYGTRISVDGAGNAYVSGETNSTDFPTTAGAFQTTFSGTEAAFVAKLSPGGTALDYSTYIGGSGEVDATGLAIDANGAAFITGLTRSMTDFPTTAGAFQTTDFGSDEAFVTKLDPTGSSLDYSTYLGGTGTDDAYNLALDGSGCAIVTGFTTSTDFPTTAGAPATTLDGSSDAFVTELNSAGSALVYSTYLGGGADDTGESVALDGLGDSYVVGYTNSTDFPTSPGAYQPALAGGNDAFVTRLATGASATVTINQAAGQADPANASPVAFDVVFSAPVTGFDASGVDLTASTAAGSLQASVSGSGSQYTVTVTGMTGPGTVVAKVRAGAALDPSGNPTPASSSTDNSVTFDNVAPTVTIAQASTQADPTNVNPVVFDFQFDETVVGFNDSKVTLGGTLAGFATPGTITAGPNPYEYLVDVNIAGSHTGTITASMAAGSVTDLATNPLGTPTIGDNSVTFDNVPPGVTVTRDPAQGSPGGGLSVAFDVSFSEPVVNFTAADIDTAGTTASGATFGVTNSGDNTNFTVTATGMTAGGVVQLAVDPGVVTDPAGNFNTGGGPVPITYVHSGVLQFSQPTFSVTEIGNTQATATVTRTSGSEGILSVDYATADGTGANGAVAGTDYTSTSETLSWIAGDTSAKTVTIPIANDAAFEADKAFTVGLSNVSLQGALGTQSSTTVDINEEGGLSLAAANFDTTSAAGTVTITVHRLFDSVGAVSIDYATSDGTAVADRDYNSVSGTLNWADGDNNDKTFAVPVINNGVNDGRQTFNIALSGPTGNSLAGPQSTATVTLAPHNGVTINGTDKKPQSTYTDADGDQVTVGLTGKVGSLTYYLTNGKGPIAEIDLANTEPTKSNITIKAKNPKGGTGNGRVGIGEVDGTGFKSFTAKTGDLNGAGFNLTGYAGKITVGNVSGGADFLLPGALPPKAKGVSITAGVIGNGTDITVGAPIGGLTAIAVGTGGTITAPSVGAINIKGQKASKTKPAISGDFGDDVTISGVGVDPVKGKALKTFKVAGTVSDAELSVGGNVGLVSVGSFQGSNLLVGYTGPTDGTGTFTGAFTVGAFTTKAAADSFANSNVIGTSFRGVTLASADTANGGVIFGFAFHGTFGKLKVIDPALAYTGAGATQVLQGDLEVKKV
jgi:hypothetical protein